MNKNFYLPLLLLAVLILSYGCNSGNNNNPATPTNFSFTVEEDASFTNLPGLQSFAFAVADDGTWLMFGGRTNGFHGFDSATAEGFPFKMANQFIYTYNPTSRALDSMSIDSLPVMLQDPYASTNMQCRQVGGTLYVCGGYGEVNAGTPNANWVTHNVFSRISVQGMITAVAQKSSSLLAAAIAYDTTSFVRATGGELYYMPDSNFYLVVGHDYEGSYNGSTPTTTQTYLDAVHVFKIQETTTGGIDVVEVGKITDGQPNSTTQFRRRDLVVAPNVSLNAAQDNYGISIYAGVFTYGNNPQPFRNPIYINGYNSNPKYTLDATYSQYSNVYSAPNLQMFDSVNNDIYTTIFGGLGDTLASNLDTPLADSAAFTKFIITLKRANATGSTSQRYNSSMMPDYIGAEGTFIRSASMPLYHNNNLGIMDLNKMQDNTVVGYIYGGIKSNLPQWHDTTNITYATPKVLKVTFKKN